MKRVTGFHLTNELLAELDWQRGLINRSAYVEELLRRELGMPTQKSNIRPPNDRQLNSANTKP